MSTLYRYVGIAVVVVGLLWFVLYLHKQVNNLKKDLASAKLVIEQQSKLDQVVVESTTKIARRDKDVSTTATEAVISVRNAEGSHLNVPPDVIISWRSAIARMRDDTANTSSDQNP